MKVHYGGKLKNETDTWLLVVKMENMIKNGARTNRAKWLAGCEQRSVRRKRRWRRRLVVGEEDT